MSNAIVAIANMSTIKLHLSNGNITD